MSKFHTATNEKRVDKMVEALGHLKKSAVSNKATKVEIGQLFAPFFEAYDELMADGKGDAPVENVTQAIMHDVMTGSGPDFNSREGDLVPAADGTPRERGANPDTRTPLWSSIKVMAEQAPLEDLGQAVAVYATRLDDALYEIKQADLGVAKANKTPKLSAPIPPAQVDEGDDAWD